MAYDRYEAEYHLTPAGWVIGTITDFGNTEAVIEPPADRVETWLYEMEQSLRMVERSETHPTMTVADRNIVRKSFPPPRGGFPMS
jgi:hypothetical protein